MIDETAEGPGARLKTTRESMEVSSREIADALNLPQRVVECLESDDYEQLPPTVFTRGYLRSYARLLELPPDELLELYPEVAAATDTGSHDTSVVEIQRGLTIRTLSALGAGLLVLIATVYWLTSGSVDEESASQEVSEAEVSEVDVSEVEVSEAEEVQAEAVAVENSEPAAAEQQPAQQPLQQPRQQAEQSQATEIDPPAEQSPIASPPQVPLQTVVAEVVSGEPGPEVSEVVPPGRRERRITEFGEDRLIFSFQEDCWVEVKSEAGDNLYSDLNRAGGVLVLTGRGPFRILLGYAPGVSLEFNDQTVDVSASTRNNVANLVLGR